jgi:hypothetical protein
LKMTSITDLDDLCLVKIGKCLPFNDQINLSHASSRFYNLLSEESWIWRKGIEINNFSMSPVILKRAEDSSIVGCEQKKLFFVCQKISTNMKLGRFQAVQPQSCINCEPKIVDDSVFWIDWPGLRLAKSRKQRRIAIASSSLTIFEYNGVMQQICSIDFQVPEPFSKGIALAGKFSVEVDRRKRFAVLAADEPKNEFGCIPARRLISVALTSPETKVLMTYSHPFTWKGLVLLSGEKTVLILNEEIKFIDICSGAVRSLDISEIFRAYSGCILTESNDRNIAVIGLNGLIVDPQTETIRFVLQLSLNLGYPIKLIMNENVLVLFFTLHGATVWNLGDGSRTREKFGNSFLMNYPEVLILQKETMKVAYVTWHAGSSTTKRRITFLQRNERQKRLNVEDHVDFEIFDDALNSFQKPEVIHQICFLFDIRRMTQQENPNLDSVRVLARSAIISQSEIRTYYLPIDKELGEKNTCQEILHSGTKFVVWYKTGKSKKCSKYKVAIYDFS